MSGKTIRPRRCALLLPLALISAGFARAAEVGDEVVLRYERDPSERARATRPQADPLPEPLRLAHDPPPSTTPRASAARTRPQGSPDIPPPAPPARGDERFVERGAGEAAQWTAERLVAGPGQREYYRVGLHAGLRESARQPAGGGARDYIEGQRSAWQDSQARAEGGAWGRSAAAELAQQAAGAQVAAQFRDLDVEPRFLPVPRAPRFEPVPPRVAEPTLDEVLSDYPLLGPDGIAQPHAVYVRGWEQDARTLLRCESYGAFYVANWADPARAFEFWRGDPGRAAIYRGLSVRQQQAFRAAFEAEFPQRLGRLFHGQLEQAYEAGFADGWSYGTFVQDELSYRRGYRDGFLDAWADAAGGAFEHAYPGRYLEAYGLAFAGWAEQPHPAIDSVRLIDGNDDGVFEPGEPIFAEYELINYGGRGGRLQARLDGSSLEATGRVEVDLPARGRMQAAPPLAARIAGRAATGPTELDFTIAEQRTTVPLRISHPLQFVPASLETRRDNLSGDVRLDLRVENQSRRPVTGRVELSSPGVAGLRLDRPLGSVPAGGYVPLSFEIHGVDPLELIAGRVSFDLSAISDGVMHHHFEHRLPETFRDLGSRDLPMLLVRQSNDRRVTDADVAAARDLLLLRLRADWTAAANGGGNPYKKDFRSNGTRTALGDLVAIYREESGRMARPDVFDGLSGEVLELAEVLPGVHPRLRKYVRRLAEELP